MQVLGVRPPAAAPGTCSRRRPLLGRRGSRPGARSAPRSAAGTARRRCAAGRTSRRPRRPRPWCPAPSASCRPASRSRCPRSSPRTCRRTRSTPRRRATRPGRCRAPTRSSRSGLSPTRSIRSEWQVGWYVTRCGYDAPTSVTPSTSTSSSDSSYVFAATAAARRGQRVVAVRPGHRRVLVPDRPDARPGRRHHHLVRLERLDVPAHQRQRLVRVAGVDVHLPAAGLPGREHDLVPEPLQQLDRGPPGGRGHGVDQAGQEQRDPHVHISARIGRADQHRSVGRIGRLRGRTALEHGVRRRVRVVLTLVGVGQDGRRLRPGGRRCRRPAPRAAARPPGAAPAPGPDPCRDPPPPRLAATQ